MAVQYVGSTKWAAVTPRANSTVYAIGDIRRQAGAISQPAANTPGLERVFRCTTNGTSAAAESSTSPNWLTTAITKGATVTDGGVTWTEVTGRNDWGTWATPHRTLAAAFAWMAAGDDCAVHDAHNEATIVTTTVPAARNTAMFMLSPGTALAPCKVVCVNDANTARSTGAQVMTGTGQLTFIGFCHSYGVTYLSGTVTTPSIQFGYTVGPNDGPFHWIIEQGGLSLPGNINVRVVVGQVSGTVQGQLLELVNTDVAFANANQGIEVPGQLIWRGGTVTGTIPTQLFQFSSGFTQGDVLLEGVNLNPLSAKTIFTLGQGWRRHRAINCRLPATVTRASGMGTTIGAGGPSAEFINCNSGDVNYDYSLQNFMGTITHETTIVRGGGASDGTTTISRKMVSTSSHFLWPLKFAIEFWNDTAGSARTLNIPVLIDLPAPTPLTDAEAWIEAQYLGTSGFPLELRASDRLVDSSYGTALEQTLDPISTWTTTGFSNAKKYLLAVNVTPQEKGLIRVTVCLAKPSTTLYVDPLVQIS